MDSIIKGIDPITFEIVSHRLHQITREMGATLERVGGTVNTTQQKDYMAAVYRANGDVLSAGDSMGWHVACAGFAVKRIIERFGDDGGIYPDDVFLLNDPYLAAIHQSDVYLVSPIHFKEKLVGWSATFVHVMDIGAMSPGGNSPGATEIFHEGLRIPGIKLIERGRLRKDVFDTLINMTRQPVMVGLDLKCEIAANNVAKSRMQEMFAQYGPELVDAVSSEMIRYSESILRKRLAEIPDGSWSDTGLIESGESWKIVLKLTKKGDHLVFDFTGSAPQAKKGINLPYHATFGGCYESLLSSMGYDLPKNQGVFGVMKVIAPEGTVVNVRYPGPVSMNTTAAGAIVKYQLARSVLMQMLATSEKWKREVVAVTAGHRTVRHAGYNQHGRYYVTGLGSENAVGGNGAVSYKDGIDSGGTKQTCPNVEWVELNFPLLYLFRRHLKDGIGAGKFRGGAGSELAVTVHDAPEGKIKGVAMGAAGLRNSGHGIFGGYPGAPSLLVLREGTRLEESLSKSQLPDNLKEIGGQARLLPYCEFELKKSDVLCMQTHNGGGYGDPLERDPDLVLNDIENGLLSIETARDIYGVALDGKGDTLDLPATEKIRTRLRENRLKAAG